MKILAIDTSSKICGVALLEDDNIIDEINLDNGQTHSENLMPIIDKILSKNNVKLSEINLIGCCVGPGSFTGIRIGVATVKALAEVNNIPIASITSLEILAKLDNSEKTKVSIIDARNNQVYCGIFDASYNKKQEYIAGDILEVIDILKKYDNLICIGDGALLHKEIISENIKNAEFCEYNTQKAALAGRLAYSKFLNNNLENADTITPLYLRKSQAERMKLKNKD